SPDMWLRRRTLRSSSAARTRWARPGGASRASRSGRATRSRGSITHEPTARSKDGTGCAWSRRGRVVVFVILPFVWQVQQRREMSTSRSKKAAPGGGAKYSALPTGERDLDIRQYGLPANKKVRPFTICSLAAPASESHV